MDKWVGRVALVTGASVGIGAAVASALVDHGMNVVGCGRNLEKLLEFGNSLKGKGKFTPRQCDVSDEESVIAMFADVKTNFGGIDVLINNAGLGKDTTLLDGKAEDWKTIMDVNVIGMSICAREAVKSMREKGANDGYIINVGSIVGHVVPTNSPNSFMYSASKHAVRALTEGLRSDVRNAGTNIRITHLSPGIVDTEFRYRMVGQERGKEFYSRLECLQVQDISDAVLYVLSTHQRVQITELTISTTEQPFQNPAKK